jgi:hypothetical protein
MRLYHEDKSKIDALEAEMQKKNDAGHSMACPFEHLHPNPAGEWQYDWSVNNWGTKWEADIIDWERSGDNEITIYCNTAWSPPIALYDYLGEQGWQVDAIYHEGGMAYAGIYKDGCDEYYEYDVTDKGSIDELPSDIIDFAGLETAHDEWLEREFEDRLVGLPRTEWYPVKVKPTQNGRYEVTTKAWEFPQYCEYKDGNWGRWVGDEIKVVQWRGLIKEYTNEDIHALEN